MAASLGTAAGARNVDLNIVPFIDLMSCMTAFLLVAAVWAHSNRLDTHAGGRGPGTLDDPPPALSVLIESDAVWIGVSRADDFQRIPVVAGHYDWTAFAAALRVQPASTMFAGRHDIEIAAASAADHPVPYDAIVHAMDAAVGAGFTDVAVTDPHGLSGQPRL